MWSTAVREDDLLEARGRMRWRHRLQCPNQSWEQKNVVDRNVAQQGFGLHCPMAALAEDVVRELGIEGLQDRGQHPFSKTFQGSPV